MSSLCCEIHQLPYRSFFVVWQAAILSALTVILVCNFGQLSYRKSHVALAWVFRTSWMSKSTVLPRVGKFSVIISVSSFCLFLKCHTLFASWFFYRYYVLSSTIFFFPWIPVSGSFQVTRFEFNDSFIYIYNQVQIGCLHRAFHFCHYVLQPQLL